MLARVRHKGSQAPWARLGEEQRAVKALVLQPSAGQLDWATASAGHRRQAKGVADSWDAILSARHHAAIMSMGCFAVQQADPKTSCLILGHAAHLPGGRKRAGYPGAAPCRMLPGALAAGETGWPPCNSHSASFPGQGCGSGMQFSGTIAELGRGLSNKENRENGKHGGVFSISTLVAAAAHASR